MKKAIENIRHYLSVARLSIRLEVQRQMEYPSFLIGWFFCNPIQFFMILLTIWATVRSFGSLGGWSYEQIVFLYGIAIVSHGTSVVLFVQTWYMDSSILYGDFDRYLLRPMNVFFQFCISFFNLIGVTDLFPAVIILIYGCFLVGFAPTFWNLLQLLTVILSATFIRGAVFLFVGSVAFYIKGRNRLSDMTLTVYQYTTMYPLSIYPRIIQVLFTFVIPLGFVSYYPASDFLNIETGLMPTTNIWLISLGVAILTFSLAYLFFKNGMKRYESAGS